MSGVKRFLPSRPTLEFLDYQRLGIPFSANGGNVSFAGGYLIHSFTSVGSSNFNIISGSKRIEYLIVAGGGGAGGTQNAISAAGNGGQVLSGSTFLNLGNTGISVGNAGTQGPGWSTSSFAQPGGNSSITGLATATGGQSGANTLCCPGQSSGGTGGNGTSSAGNVPGVGISSSITGTSLTYGNTFSNAALDVTPSARPANTGDGGQSVWSNASRQGGAGGSGVVIIRYLI